jgi:hypothetical protein
MVSEAEADSEGSSGTDADEVKDSVRRRGARILKRLLRILSNVANSTGDIDSDELPVPIRIESSLVTVFVDPFASVGDFLRRVQ